jgi:hypothetical protein
MIVQDINNLNTTDDVLRRSFYECEKESLISTVSTPFITCPNKYQDNEQVKTQTQKKKTVNKRSAGPLTIENKRHKVCCISSGQGMMIVANSVETAINMLRDLATGKTSTSQSGPPLKVTISSQAIKAIEKDKGFSNCELMNTILAIENNLRLTELYLSLENKGTRTLYIRHHMEEIQLENHNYK